MIYWRTEAQMISPLTFFYFFIIPNRFNIVVVLYSNRRQKTSKCGKDISNTLSCTSCGTFLYLPHLKSSVIYYWTDKSTATRNLFVNPLTPMGDQDRISLNNIDTKSSRQVMRIKETINLGINSWSDTKFSELTLYKLYLCQ